MAHLWLRRTEREDEDWGVLPLDGNGHVVFLGAEEATPVATCEGERPESASAYIIRHCGETGAEDMWVLYAAPEPPVFVNGQRLELGIHVLADRDEIRLGRNRVYFSTEGVPQIEPFPGLAKQAVCPRCQQPIDVGVAAVKCPTCHVWHHQSEQLPCWTYDEKCSLCAQSSDLAGEFSWTPETV